MFKDSPEGQTQYEPAALAGIEDRSSIEYLKSVFDYNKDTGDIFWKIKSVYSAATVERLVQERDALKEEYALCRKLLMDRTHDMINARHNLAAVTRERDRAWLRNKLEYYGDMADLPESCLCCGQVGERAAWPMKAPKFYVCKTCKQAAEQLAAMTQERDDIALKHQVACDTIARQRKDMDAIASECIALHEFDKGRCKALAASQAREQQLRELIPQRIPNGFVSFGKHYAEQEDKFADPYNTMSKFKKTYLANCEAALSLPQDDTALHQWGAKLLREMADEYAQGAKDADKDSRVFLSEANARCAIHLRRKADELESGS